MEMVPPIVLCERLLGLICHIKGGGCQMHYKSDVNRVSSRIGPSYRDFFKTICHEMCSVATVAEHNEKKKWLDKIANIFPETYQWPAWWKARKYHISCF